MITLDQFCERLRRPNSKPVIDWSKWIGLPTAWLALLLSAWSIYITQIRKTDDLRVVISTLPSMYIDLKHAKAADFSLGGTNQTLIFINAGNRAAAITQIVLSFWFQPAKSAATPTCGEPRLNLVLIYEFAPLVIKQGEMTSLSVDKFMDGGNAVDGPDGSGAQVEVSRGIIKSIGIAPVPTTNDIMAACLSFRVILPDSESKVVAVPLGFARMQPNIMPDISSYEFPPILTPVVLVKP